VTHAEHVRATLRDRPDLLLRLADWLITDGLVAEDTCDLADEICVATFGTRVVCPGCGSTVFPGFTCWGCEEWTAPVPPTVEAMR